jgi:hypothetical protein
MQPEERMVNESRRHPWVIPQAWVHKPFVSLVENERLLSFIRIKTPFLSKCATLPSPFSGWAFSHNVARQHFLVLRHF